MNFTTGSRRESSGSKTSNLAQEFLEGFLVFLPRRIEPRTPRIMNSVYSIFDRCQLGVALCLELRVDLWINQHDVDSGKALPDSLMQLLGIKVG